MKNMLTAMMAAAMMAYFTASALAHPVKPDVPLSITGTASWYGGQFHGRQTANGEKYDMNGLTAAHKTLPFGTKVRITNSANGKSVEARINDRGPYVGDRIIDLSRGAAAKIGMLQSGTAEVRWTFSNRT